MSTPALRANERIPGWDGTALALDAHTPAPELWPVPTVVTRTAYGRSRHLAEGAGWARRGFAYVVQDVRGRYDSEGRWEPYRNERGDGAALVDWVAAQPWSDGRVVGYGGSYAGHTAWAMAVERPGAVRAVVSMGPSLSLARTKFERGGILRLAEHAAWWLERADARTSRDGLTAHVFAQRPDLLDHLPVLALADRLGAALPGWARVITDGPEHVAEGPEPTELAGTDVAALHIGGWYDLLADEVLELFDVVGSALDPRPARCLVMGPWGHDLAYAPGTSVGDRDHGPAARLDLGDVQVRWLREILHPSRPRRSQARVFRIGADRWHSLPDWPPAGTGQSWYPGPDGTLTAQAPAPVPVPVDASAPAPVHASAPAPLRVPAAEGAGAYRYDPADPYPSRAPGADRAALLTRRRDAARFTSEPLTEALVIAGRPTALLRTRSSAPDTDWIVRLNELTRDGRCWELCTGSARSERGSRDTAPAIPLGPLDVALPAGSRLQLEITSSDFPRLARSLNTAEDRYRGTSSAVAEQRILTGPRGTHVVLPVVAGPAPSRPTTGEAAR